MGSFDAKILCHNHIQPYWKKDPWLFSKLFDNSRFFQVQWNSLIIPSFFPTFPRANKHNKVKSIEYYLRIFRKACEICYVSSQWELPLPAEGSFIAKLEKLLSKFGECFTQEHEKVVTESNRILSILKRLIWIILYLDEYTDNSP